MTKKNKVLTTLFLSPFMWQTIKADTFFEEIMHMQESMMQRMQQEIRDMNALFSKTFPQDSALKSNTEQPPSIHISSQEEKNNYIVTLNFEHASLKESSCDVEFEQTPQGQNLLRILWKINGESKSDTNKSDNAKSESHFYSSSFFSSSNYSDDKKTYTAYTNENGTISVTCTHILPNNVSITDPIIKTDYETNSVEINLAKKEPVKKYSIS